MFKLAFTVAPALLAFALLSRVGIVNLPGASAVTVPMHRDFSLPAGPPIALGGGTVDGRIVKQTS